MQLIQDEGQVDGQVAVVQTRGSGLFANSMERTRPVLIGWSCNYTLQHCDIDRIWV